MRIDHVVKVELTTQTGTSYVFEGLGFALDHETYIEHEKGEPKEEIEFVSVTLQVKKS